ncbi:MAG TPA: FAD-dependent oxidoreductase, partial [Conexibacter sp.]|nr:FAD-dependent oxidoreductase [Conexibacter sp.]
MPETSRSALGPVVIAGGGVAAVETLLALRASPGGDALDVTLLAPDHDLVYRPMSVGEAFGRPLVRRYSLDAICADLGAALVEDVLSAVDGERRCVVTGSGRELPFDALVVATGARARVALPNAFTFFADTDTDADGYQWIVREVEEGTTRTIAFVVPAGVGWSLPLYELALLTAHRAWSVGAGDVAFTLVTPEETPLALFQGEGSRTVARLLGLAGIELEMNTYAHDYDGRNLHLTPGDRQIAVDRVVALPTLSGPSIDGLPLDPDGFVRVDDH